MQDNQLCDGYPEMVRALAHASVSILPFNKHIIAPLLSGQFYNADYVPLDEQICVLFTRPTAGTVGRAIKDMASLSCGPFDPECFYN